MSTLIASGNGKRIFSENDTFLRAVIDDRNLIEIEMEKAAFMREHPNVFPVIELIDENSYLIEALNTARVMAFNGIMCKICMSEDDNANEFFDHMLEYIEAEDNMSAKEFLTCLADEGAFIDAEATVKSTNDISFVKFIDDALLLLSQFLHLDVPMHQQDYLDLCARQFGYRGEKLLIFDW